MYQSIYHHYSQFNGVDQLYTASATLLIYILNPCPVCLSEASTSTFKSASYFFTDEGSTGCEGSGGSRGTAAYVGVEGNVVSGGNVCIGGVVSNVLEEGQGWRMKGV